MQNFRSPHLDFLGGSSSGGSSGGSGSSSLPSSRTMPSRHFQQGKVKGPGSANNLGSSHTPRSPSRALRLNSQEDSSSESDSSCEEEGKGQNERVTVSGDRFSTMSIEDLDIMQTIGIGNFGKVVLSQDTETSEFYALKILSISDVIEMNQREHIRNERDMLRAVRGHPFIVNMLWFGKDEFNIYFLMEYASGGELFSYLRKAGKFSLKICTFYAAEIVLALEFLHSKNIAHRDLKPENLLLDKNGHLKITDFGFAKRFRTTTRTICGTPEYLAPEVIMSEPYTKAVDWWALGVLIFEMLVGRSPFYNEDKMVTYQMIVSGILKFPENNFDSVAEDLVRKLLTIDKANRLGYKLGAAEVKRHVFFAEFAWFKVYSRKLSPPIIPKVFYAGDTGNFGEYPDNWDMRPVTQEQLAQFADF